MRCSEGQGATILARCVELYREGGTIEINEQSDGWALHFRDRSRGSVQESEFSAGLDVNVITRLLRRPFRPMRLQFAHDCGSRKATLERLYGCPLENGECDGVVVAIKDINATVVEADMRLLSILKSHADGLLRRPPSMRSSIVQDVEGAVLDQLPSKTLTAAAIADKLGLSKSSLRRKMAAQGVAFGDIVDRVRAGLAERYLDEGQKVKHVAYLCGYKSSSAFNAARRRWRSTKGHLQEGDD